MTQVIGKVVKKDRLPTPVFLGFPRGSVGEESACNAGDLGLTPGLGRFPGEGNSYPLQYSGLENPMNYIVHGVAKRQTRLSDFHFTLLKQVTAHGSRGLQPDGLQGPVQRWSSIM